MQWNTKNRLIVASETFVPPSKIAFKDLPMNGTTSTKLLDTTAAQYDICPHGKTLPRKPVNIVNMNASVPTTHGPSRPNEYDLQYTFLNK